MRIWVTRTEPEAATTAERLRELGHDPLVAPVLELRQLNPHISLDGVGAVAFTSPNGVRLCPNLDDMLQLPAFTVGDATAGAARRAGFRRPKSAGKDGQALAKLMAAELDPSVGTILVVRGQESAFDLAAALEAKGFVTRSAIVYSSSPKLPVNEIRAALHDTPPLEAVLVHSPRGGRQAARLLGRVPGAAALRVFAISPAAAAPLRAIELKSLDAAPFPTEAALLKLLSEPREGP
jgi:uroporphyrinogen-III synthase